MAPIPKVGRSHVPQLLRRLKMKQTDFAKSMGMSDSMITQIINGDRNFSLVRAKQAADILECSIDDLNEWIYD